MKVYTMKTPLGWSAACFSQEGLLLLTLPVDTQESALEEAWDNFNQLMSYGKTYLNRSEVNEQESLSAKLYLALLDYFEMGKNDFFNIPIDWSITSEFAREVYKVVAGIPYGEVRTYSWVAEKISKPKAARAVGQALKRNPYPLVIPCHRVVAAKGLGGYGGGLEMKKKLLDHEGCKLIG